MCATLFNNIEEKKLHFVRLEQAYKRQKGAQEEAERVKHKIMKDDAENWDTGRENRTQNWRDFNMKKTKIIKKQKKFDERASDALKVDSGIQKKLAAPKRFFEMRAAPTKPEERRDAPKEEGRPMGIQTEYKKLWR
jgi:hypothetical protein